MDPTKQKQIPTRINLDKYEKFKDIADVYHQSLSARIAYLIDKDIAENWKEEYRKKNPR